MPKPVVIFGAGASYDAIDIENNSIKTDQYAIEACRLPLTNDLFHPKYGNKGFERSGFLNDFMYEATQEIRWGGQDLEGFFRYFQQTRVNNQQHQEERWKNQRQLLAVRYYLCTLLAGLHSEFKTLVGKRCKSDNYCRILRMLLHNNPEGAVLITFNYDLFLEEAIRNVLGYDCNSIEAYYKDRAFPLFKLHGSINWGYNVSDKVPSGDLASHIKFLSENETITNEYLKKRPDLIGVKQIPHSTNFLPAIHIPLPDQKDFLIKEHESMVIKALEETDKLILIGWSGRDEYMVNLLKGKVRTFITSVMVVSGSKRRNESDAGRTLQTITDTENPWKWKQEENNGFSGLTMQKLDEFLQRT